MNPDSNDGLRIAFFGSSLVSAYWNGAATYYRGIVRALAARGHRITFFEPDAHGRQAHRDIADPPWATVQVYAVDDETEVRRALSAAAGADLVVKASGVGVFDRLLEEEVAALRRPDGSGPLVAFWDVDAPATLDRLAGDPGDPFHALVPRYDVVFTYGGGAPVIDAYQAVGAQLCVPIYNGLDPDVHHPAAADPRFAGHLGFLANRLPDREARVDEFFFGPAAALPDRTFVIGGNGWQQRALPANVRAVGHVFTADHNAFNASTLAVLNVNRDSMARFGFSPATRVFEAAGAGTCLITDAFAGVEQFFEPGREILVARDGAEVIAQLASLTPERASEIGQAARRRALDQHTYVARAQQVDDTLTELQARRRARSSAPVPAEPTRALPLVRKAAAGPGALDIVIVGLSITSAWGNGHATTYRALVKGLADRGHRVRFLERDVPWYAPHRDLPAPPYADTHLYSSLDELRDRHAAAIREADVTIVGSYVPQGAVIGDWVRQVAGGHVVFYDIDTPITLAALENGGADYLTRQQIPSYDLYLSFTGGPMLQTLERELGAAMVRPLYCGFDPDMYHPKPAPARWDLGYLGTYSPDRQHRMDALLCQPAERLARARFVVAGSQYPAALTWPANVERVDHVPPDQHRDFYCGQRFTLSITRADMMRAGFSPSVRLFEAAGCGVPIITDRWPGLETFFDPGREILVADSAEDVVAHLTTIDDEQRHQIARRARQRVLAEHTAAHRAAQLEGYVAELRALPAQRRRAQGA